MSGPSRSRRQWTAVAAGVVAALSTGALARFGVERAAPHLRPLDIVSTAPPAAADSYYLAYDRGGHVDHHVIYHGTDAGVVENLRSSHVLLLGNSRLLFAFTRQDLRGFFSRHGLTYYMLAFGHREHDEFPRAIIRRFDLRPRLVIVNADRFFLGDESGWAERVMNDSWFDAQKLWLEAEASHAVRRALHGAVPHVPDLIAGERELIAYRSRVDGTWVIATSFAGLGAAMPRPETGPAAPDPGQLQRARAFKAEIEARGGRLVLCLVPAPNTSRPAAEWLARELDVALIAPAVDDLRTFDGSHLTRESAARFAGAFFDELAPVLREMGLAGQGRE